MIVIDWIVANFGIDWIATVFTLVGTFLQTRGTEKPLVASFVVCFIGNMLWLIFAITTPVFSMIVTGVMFGIMNGMAFFKWYKKVKSKEEVKNGA